MSSYIIAGSADSIDTAYCEEIARRIKAKYKNIDFRIVIKHPSEWEEYLQQVCRIYGFLNKSNPIVYTFDGKIIGNKESFINTTVKYFGIPEESLIIPNLTNAINVKLANEELKQKNIVKNNVKTINEKIEATYKKLLKENILKHEFQKREEFLVKGIEYSLIELSNLCTPINFPHDYHAKIEKEEVQASSIDLLALSLQDQVKPEETGTNPAFVTTTNAQQQQQSSESMQKMSEASRTNRLHSSVMSRDGDSKVKGEEKREGKIDEEYDDVADFTDHNMEGMVVCEIGDGFYLSFEKVKAQKQGEMVLYYNQNQNNNNSIRIYNDGRSVLGHRNLIKQIHFIGEDQIQTQPQNQDSQQPVEEQSPQNKEEEVDRVDQINKQAQKKQQPVNQKSKTEPNIPPHSQPPKQQQSISEIQSDLNLVSNLNYHTLYIHRPLSSTELKHLLYLVRETNTFATVQFLPENPNPLIKVYYRGFLLGEKDGLLPVQKFIKKQLEDEEYQNVKLPHEPSDESIQQVEVKIINNLHYSHYYIEHTGETNDEHLCRALKLTIDELLNIEERIKKQIGYNIIVCKDYTLIIALCEPYKTYGQHQLYFDGLAYLGMVQVAKVVEPYQMKKQPISTGEHIQHALAKCSAFVEQQ